MQGNTDMEEKTAISKEELLKEANELVKSCDDYIHGVKADNVSQRDGTFVFSGDYFLKEDGTPSSKTLAVFNCFKFLNQNLSKKYFLEQ